MGEDEVQLDPADVAAHLAGAYERLKDDLHPDSREELEASIREAEARTASRPPV